MKLSNNEIKQYFEYTHTQIKRGIKSNAVHMIFERTHPQASKHISIMNNSHLLNRLHCLSDNNLKPKPSNVYVPLFFFLHKS